MSSETKHTPGPWKPSYDKGNNRDIITVNGSLPICSVRIAYVGEEQYHANAHLIAAAPELLTELQAAHQIIRNALAVMSTKQKLEWGRRNARDGVEGEGVTRANEREAVIARATGQEG